MATDRDSAEGWDEHFSLRLFKELPRRTLHTNTVVGEGLQQLGRSQCSHNPNPLDAATTATNKGAMTMTDTPKLWRDMTPEEKGALLLAEHDGKVIEVFGGAYPYRWYEDYPVWDDDYAYRIKPEPKRETLKLYGKNGWCDPAIGTIDLIDGKPDPASIKIEEL